MVDKKYVIPSYMYVCGMHKIGSVYNYYVATLE